MAVTFHDVLANYTIQILPRSFDTNPILEFGDALHNEVNKLSSGLPNCSGMHDQLPAVCNSLAGKLNEGFPPPSCSHESNQVGQLICACKTWNPSSFLTTARPCLEKVCPGNVNEASNFISRYANALKSKCNEYVPKIEEYTRTHPELFPPSTTVNHQANPTPGGMPTLHGSGNGHTGGAGGHYPSDPYAYNSQPTTNPYSYNTNPSNSPYGTHSNGVSFRPIGFHSGAGGVKARIMGTVGALLIVGAFISAL